MDELHSHGTLTRPGSHPFYRTVPHISYRKKTGNIRLNKKGIPLESPSLGVLPLSYKVGARQDEPAFVALHDIREPFGARQRSDEDEHRARRHTFNLVCIRTMDRNFFQVRFAMRFGHAAVRPNLDIGH